MRIDEAVRALVADTTYLVWIRPVLWRRLGSAYTLKDGELVIVPSSRGGDRAPCPAVDLLLGEWEVVDARVVNDENAR